MCDVKVDKLRGRQCSSSEGAGSAKGRVMVVYGTRPEAIKVAPVVLALAESRTLEPIVVVTAQHREMLDQVNEVFGIVPDIDLNLMAHGQTLNGIAGSVISKIDAVLEMHKPDAVLVEGDTTTVMGAAIAAFNREIPVVHLEAGLRSGDINSPSPRRGQSEDRLPDRSGASRPDYGFSRQSARGRSS